MSKSSDIPRSPLHRIGVAGPARSRALDGIGTPKINRFRGRRDILAVAALALCGLAFITAPAFAEHTFSGTSFGSGTLSGDAVAVDQETGNVYIASSPYQGGASEKGVIAGIGVFGADGSNPTGEAHGFIFPVLFEPGMPPGSYPGYAPKGVAVDNACYYHVPRLAAGTPECEALDPSNGDVYYTNNHSNAVQKFALDLLTGEYEVVQEFPYLAPNGSPVGGNETTAAGVAVDEQGNVYFVDPGTTEVAEFNPRGEKVGTIAQGLIKRPVEVAVGAPGVVYVGYESAGVNTKHGVAKIVVNSKDQVQSEATLDENGSAVAVDEQGNVYVYDGSSVSEYDSTGDLVGTFGSSGPGALPGYLSAKTVGVAVDDVTGQVYVSAGTEPDEVVEIFDPVVVHGPVISGEQVTEVAVSAATLQAAIDPNGSATSYHFEYDTREYKEGEGPHGTSTSEVAIGSGEVSVPVSVRLEGLQPGGTYYYRVVAESEAEPGKQFDGPGKTLTTTAPPSSAPETCPNAGLRAEQPYGLGLPDCRGYEMVSPLEKNDSDAVTAENDAARSSLSGDVFTYKSLGIFAGPEAGWAANQYLARRGSDGWSDQGIAPPLGHTALGLGRGAYDGMAFTPELTEGIALTDTPLTGEAIPGYGSPLPEWDGLYLADFASAPVSYRVVAPNTGLASAPPIPQVQGVSADFSHVVYTVGGNTGAAEWVDGKLFTLAGAGGGDYQPGEDNSSSNDSWRSVSADGSRVFFTTNSSGRTNIEENPGRQLFVEENPTSPNEDCSIAGDKCILEISKSQRATADPLGPGAARFRGASVSGSRVFFTDCSKLTEDATAVANEPETTCYPTAETGNDLYEYDLETGVVTDLTDVTEAEKAEDPLGAKVVGVPYISENGEYVYFVAEGALTGENAEGKQPVSGEPNLYVSHLQDGSWMTSFIATLASSTSSSAEGLQEGGDSAVWNQIAPLDRVRATADGAHLAFVSHRSLTGYDNEQAEAGECEKDISDGGSEGGACGEVFSYDVVSRKLVCVSCDPSGARPVGPSSLEENAGAAERVGYTRRNFSENGVRLFFDSDDALVVHDSSGRQNVYEFEQSATQAETEKAENSCTSSSSSFSESGGGCIFAISDVAGDYESFFLDADPSGGNVFFATEDQLVLADTDNHVDVYDARVGGGFPVSPPAPECDNGDSCKPPASPQPEIFGVPSSAAFSGPGNPVSAAAAPPSSKKVTKKAVKCKKGFVKNKKGKCVKSKKGKKKAKKSTHRKGSK